jgi:hypothetical protein
MQKLRDCTLWGTCRTKEHQQLEDEYVDVWFHLAEIVLY